MADRTKKFSEKEIEQRVKTIEKAKKTISEIASQWKEDPNVLSLGYGLRSKKGKLKTEIVISFMVKTKVKGLKKIKDLGSRPIPAKIKGIPTDVVEIGVMKPDQATGERDERAYDPLVGGCASSNADSHVLFWNGYGTLGSICFDGTSGDAMALSNWHVWAEGGEQGDDIIQPGHPRTEDRVQAYFEAAFCGPAANLIEWEAPSALTSALYGGAAAAAAAAAASDVIDPSRKGQGKTAPGAGEMTDKESIDMKIEYLTQPIPGTPFKLKVGWDYTRHTDKKSYHYHQEENIENKHVLVSKHLRTSKTQYRPGERVELFGLLQSNMPFDCDYYYVVAYLIPLADETRRIPVVLHPSLCQTEKICVDFSGEKPATTLPNRFTRLQAQFKAPGGEPFQVVDMYQHDEKGELALFPKGMYVKVPPSGAVEAQVVTFAGLVGMKAYSQGRTVGQAVTTPQEGIVHNLRIEGDGIDHVEFFGGDNEASLLTFCYQPMEPVSGVGLLTHRATTHVAGKRICCYKGAITLDPDERPGKWNAYLFAQTVNIVPEGVPPETAAQLIGGLPVSQNMENAQNVPESDIECGACDIVDFMFEVI